MVDEEETAHSFNELQQEIERQLEEKANRKRARKQTLGMFFRMCFCVFMVLTIKPFLTKDMMAVSLSVVLLGF
jgi:hypothetical protein